MSVVVLTVVPGHGLDEFSLSLPALFFMIQFTSQQSSTLKINTFFYPVLAQKMIRYLIFSTNIFWCVCYQCHIKL